MDSSCVGLIDETGLVFMAENDVLCGSIAVVVILLFIFFIGQAFLGKLKRVGK